MEITQMPHSNDSLSYILITQSIWLYRSQTPILQSIAIWGMLTQKQVLLEGTNQ
jgi:hypothetical protein